MHFQARKRGVKTLDGDLRHVKGDCADHHVPIVDHERRAPLGHQLAQDRTKRLVERLAQCLPTAELAEIADAGHMAPLTDPHLIDPMIAAHIRFAEQMEQLDETHYREAA